ncbi:OmpA family protein (fragment) [Shewanella benthica]|uniref:OmpA family protein n=2 Tax=Shewanella benthica TaxID=43661 RepID=A0A330M8M5_9GAMM
MSAKPKLSLTEKLDLFGKAGTLRWEGSNTGPFSYNSDNGWSPMIGIGLEYKLTRSWVARVEYQYFDSVGASDYNLKLSKRHAESVAGHLKELGVSDTQISIEALGEAHPEVDNITQVHRANNRRVYITLR